VKHQQRRPEPAAQRRFTLAEYAALARLRRAIEAGAYDDDLAPTSTAFDRAARPGGSASPPPRRRWKIDGESLVAGLNAAGMVAAIAAAQLASTTG
jgi:hypothetical protein